MFKKQSDICNDTEISDSIEQEKKVISSIEFQLNNNNDIDIKFYWKELFPEDDYIEVKKMAINYAVLISLIDSGGFRNDIIKILSDSTKNNTEENKMFINMVLENILDIDKNVQKNLSKPLISPSQAFKQYADK